MLNDKPSYCYYNDPTSDGTENTEDASRSLCLMLQEGVSLWLL